MMVTPDSTFEDLEKVRHALGLDKSIWQQYVEYVTNILHGDFGDSYYFQRPVLDLLQERLPATLKIQSIALLVSLPLAILFGIISAIKRNSILDNAVTIFVVAGRSIPSFWFGLLMVMIFSVNLGWLPPSGYGEPSQLIMPVIAVAAGMGGQCDQADQILYAGCHASGLHHDGQGKRCERKHGDCQTRIT